MDILEAKKLFDNSIRSLAICMDQIKDAAASPYITYNQPLYEHLAYCTRIEPGELCDSETCLRFLNVLNYALDKAAKYEAMMDKEGVDEQLYMVANMIAGHICIEYPQNLLMCAQDVINLSSSLLGKYSSREDTKELRVEIADEFFDEASKVLAKYGYEKASKESSDQMRYLNYWMKDKIDSFFK